MKEFNKILTASHETTDHILARLSMLQIPGHSAGRMETLYYQQKVRSAAKHRSDRSSSVT